MFEKRISYSFFEAWILFLFLTFFPLGWDLLVPLYAFLEHAINPPVPFFSSPCSEHKSPLCIVPIPLPVSPCVGMLSGHCAKLFLRDFSKSINKNNSYLLASFSL